MSPGKYLATETKTTINIYDAGNGSFSLLKTIYDKDSFMNLSGDFSPDGKYLLSNSLKVYNVSDGSFSFLKTIPYDEDDVSEISFSPDGKLLAIGTEGMDGRIYMFYMDGKKFPWIKDLYICPEWGWNVTFSPNGEYLAVIYGYHIAFVVYKLGDIEINKK